MAPNRLNSRVGLVGSLGAVLFVVAITLRVVLASQPGLWVDEIFSLAMATGHSLEHPAVEADPAFGDFVEPSEPQPSSTFRRYMEHESVPAGLGRVVRAVSLSDTSPPLYYVVLSLWTRAFGTSDATLRLFSTFWAAACFPLLWLLGVRLGGRRVALAGWLLFAFSPPALYYASEGRMYAMLWFLCLLLAWSTLALERQGRALVAVAWVVAAAAGLLTHYFFAFVLAASVVWLLGRRERVSRALVASLVAMAGAMVLAWYVEIPESLGRWRVTQGWLNTPLSWTEVFSNPGRLAWSYLSLAGPWAGSRRGNIVALAFYAAIAALILRYGTEKLVSGDRRFLWLLVAASVTGPVVFDLTQGTHSSSIARYALQGLPVALLLLATGVCSLPRRVSLLVLMLIPVVWLPGIRNVLANPARPWQPFPQVAQHLGSSMGGNDLVIVHSIPSGVLGVARYMDAPVPMISWVPQLQQRHVGQMERLATDHRRVALVRIHDLDEPSPAEDWLLRHATLESTSTLVAAPRAEIHYFVTRPK